MHGGLPFPKPGGAKAVDDGGCALWGVAALRADPFSGGVVIQETMFANPFQQDPFITEVQAKYDNANYVSSILRKLHQTMQNLPLAAVVGKRFAAMHGGPAMRSTPTSDFIQTIVSPVSLAKLADSKRIEKLKKRTGYRFHIKSNIRDMFTWARPSPRRWPSTFTWTDDLTGMWLKLHDLERIIRGHCALRDGVTEEHGERLVTLHHTKFYSRTQGRSGDQIGGLLRGELLGLKPCLKPPVIYCRGSRNQAVAK